MPDQNLTTRRSPGTGRVERICQNPGCKKRFTSRNDRPGKACSRECAGVIKRNRQTRVCVTCGKEFLFAPSQLNHHPGAGSFCSKPCQTEGMVQGSANAPIKDRYQRTYRRADRLWQSAVRERDGYTCQRCGEYDQHIHTHHVAPRSLRPDLRYDVDNGKCLCNSCHTWCHHHPHEAAALGMLSDASDQVYQKKEPVKCVVCGSDKRHAGHGYCIKHYKRFKKYGDPLLTKRHGGGAGDAIVRVEPNASMR